ncbi:MAG TPA: dienelactone hydrolase family protein [Steroidobacteraceae bacterium]|nr:dienelactone hydrolase family protein [Steroidobacteraceae bacterium]
MTMKTSGTDHDPSEAKSSGATRREFVASSAALGLAAATSVGLGAEREVIEKNVEVKTGDGVCDAAFFHPAAGTHPGVLIWTDIFGLRPAFRAIGRRLAAQGYAVLVPNPFYRTARAPVVVDASSFDFTSPADRAKADQWTASLRAPGAIERDAEAHTSFLDAQPQVDRARKLGTQGYCMGGPSVFKTAARVPGRIAAAATFHGGGLVTDKPDSPHLLVPRIKARMYLAIAASDDAKQPDAKDKLREAFASAHVPAEIEVYAGTIHGWCVPDMPRHDGTPIYNKPDAERAWGKLLELYRTVLA